MSSISVEQLAAWREAKTAHTLLDVREDAELAVCAITDALHIPMAQIPSRLQDLPQDQPLVVMCHHGMRSMRVVNYLHGTGHTNAVNLDGGIDAWARNIDPSVDLY